MSEWVTATDFQVVYILLTNQVLQTRGCRRQMKERLGTRVGGAIVLVILERAKGVSPGLSGCPLSRALQGIKVRSAWPHEPLLADTGTSPSGANKNIRIDEYGVWLRHYVCTSACLFGQIRVEFTQALTRKYVYVCSAALCFILPPLISCCSFKHT